MIKILLFLFTLLPLILSFPTCSRNGHNGHIRSTFDLNNLNYQSNSNYELPEVSLRLIQTGEETPPKWMTEDGVLQLIRQKIKFMDITDNMELGTQYKSIYKREFPVQPVFDTQVNFFIGNLKTDYMKENLVKLTSFQNRYYRSYGAESSDWLYKHIFDIIKNANDANLKVDVSVKKFKHNWEQNSIIARFEGNDTNKQHEVVIIGAHQDSINLWSPRYGRAPGADDDGSGTVTILEAFRALVAGQFRPKRSVEFHWYAAEEVGLLGSQAVASVYEKQQREVIAMLQNDMTGFVGRRGNEAFGLVNDYVDQGLTTFVTKLVDNYASIPYKLTRCGYACSDHASWRKAGYPSAFAIENEFSDTNPHIHSPNDLVEHLSFEHMLEFSKLAVSFAVELSLS